jgi:hypothetical protein
MAAANRATVKAVCIASLFTMSSELLDLRVATNANPFRSRLSRRKILYFSTNQLAQ